MTVFSRQHRGSWPNSRVYWKPGLVNMVQNPQALYHERLLSVENKSNSLLTPCLPSHTLCLHSRVPTGPTTCPVAGCPGHHACVPGGEALALLVMTHPTSYACCSELGMPPLAPPSFQVPWANFLLWNIPENGSLPTLAFLRLLLRPLSALAIFCLATRVGY